LAFSPDGKFLWSEDWTDILKAWNLHTRKETSINLAEEASGLRPLFKGSGARHPSAPLLALPEGDTIQLIDLLPLDSSESGFRQAKARFDPTWHSEEIDQSKAKADWFGAAFHCALLAENAPWDADKWEGLELFCGKLGDHRPALAVCDRLLQRDSTLGPIYLQRSAIRMRGRDTWGGWADFLSGVYYSISDHPDWTPFADEANTQGHEAANIENWPRAIRYFTLASTWQPPNLRNLHWLAWATLASGDEKGYRRVCRLLYAHFGNLEGRRKLFTLSVLLGQHMQPLTPAPLVIDRAVQLNAAERAYAIVWTATLLPESGSLLWID
jgi:hypothetical protein